MTRRVSREVERAHRALLRWFEERGLDPREICSPLSDDLEHYNRLLETVQVWVEAHRRWPSREELERRGFRHPPVFPGIGPEGDWFLFRRWVTGQPLTWSYVDVFGALPHPDGMDEKACAEQIKRISENLLTKRISLAIHREVPATLTYRFLWDLLTNEKFDAMPPDAVHWIDGCSGFCPDCFQRPWCEVGQEPEAEWADFGSVWDMDWEEEEEADEAVGF